MRWLVLLFFSISTTVLSAQTIELTTMKDLQKHLSKDQLIVFDIDNTIYHLNQDFGCDEWFFNELTRRKENGENPQEAFQKVYSEYFVAQTLSDVYIVENETVSLISDLQKSGYTVMALTTRSMNLIYPTNRQLRSLSIDMSKTAPSQKDIFFNNPLGVLFSGGILFTCGTDKGDAFNTFCDRIQYKPKKVVFINDKLTDLVQVEKGCEKRKIPFIGFRYGYLDDKVKRFTPDISDIQKAHFKGILSNEEAIKLLK